MARKTLLMLEDDLVGGEADVTVSFGYDGVDYAVDLNEENANELKSTLEKFVEVARKVPRSGNNTRSRRNSTKEAAEIRAWAIEHGLEVSERGRIPQSIVDQWNDRNKS